MAPESRKRDKGSPRQLARLAAGLSPWALLPLTLLFPVAGMVVWGQFDGLYGQDPFAYYGYATGPVRQWLLHAEPLPPFFWPPGYPVLVALASFIVGPSPLAGQLVSLMAGAAIPFLSAVLAHEICRSTSGTDDTPGGWVPLLTGLLVAVTGQLWQSSAVIMADTTGLASGTLGVWALARYGRPGDEGGGLGWMLLGTIALGFAMLARWIYGLVAVPCALYVLAILRTKDVRRVVMHGGMAVLTTALILCFTLAPALRSWRDPRPLPLPFAGSFQVYSWNPAHAFQRVFLTTDGRLSYRLPNGLYYALVPAVPFYFTPLLAVLILPGSWAVLRRPFGSSWWLIVGWAVIVYGFHAGAQWQNVRFGLAYLVPLALMVAMGVDTLRRVLSPRFRPLLDAYVAMGLIAMLAGGLLLMQGFIARKEADLGVVRWVEYRVDEDSQILAFELTLTLKHYSELDVREVYWLTSVDIEGLRSESRPTYLLVQVDRLEAQWLGLAPEHNYRMLEERLGLMPVAAKGSYTLFYVDQGRGRGSGGRETR